MLGRSDDLRVVMLLPDHVGSVEFEFVHVLNKTCVMLCNVFLYEVRQMSYRWWIHNDAFCH